MNFYIAVNIYLFKINTANEKHEHIIDTFKYVI